LFVKGSHILTIAYAVSVHDVDWNEFMQVYYWTERSSASIQKKKSVVAAPGQCYSGSSGSFTVNMAKGDHLTVNAAVFQSEKSLPVSPASAVTSIAHAVPAPPILTLTQLSGSIETAIKCTYQISVFLSTDWTTEMVVCYWSDLHSVSSDTVPLRAAGQCSAEPTGVITIDDVSADASGLLQISAAVARQGATAINKSTLLSEVVSVTVSLGETTLPIPLCRGDQHIRGYWKQNDIQTKSFVCCDSGEVDQLALSEHCGHIAEGYVFNLHDHEGSYTHSPRFMPAGEHSCLCNPTAADRLLVSKREQYTWTPYSCTLAQWDAHSFANVLLHAL
jgi:hypothetical protein